MNSNSPHRGVVKKVKPSQAVGRVARNMSRRLTRKIKTLYRGERYKKTEGGVIGGIYSMRTHAQALRRLNKNIPMPTVDTDFPFGHRVTGATLNKTSPRFTSKLKPAAVRFILSSNDAAPFRSYWFNRFINIFVSKGKKAKALSYLFRVFGILKVLHGRTPSILVFEIMETYRLPFSVILAKRSKGLNRVHLLAW